MFRPPTRVTSVHSCLGRAVAPSVLAATALLGMTHPALAQPAPPPPPPMPAHDADLPPWFNLADSGFPAWFRHSYAAALRSPLPAQPQPASTVSASVQADAAMAFAPVAANESGGITILYWTQPDLTNPYFLSLGQNGRSCFSCHRPASAMSVSAASLRDLWQRTAGADPVFAPVDGANCPSSVATQDGAAARSLLLNRGLFRIFLPLAERTPDQTALGGPPPHPREFDVTVVNDPYGCNTDPAYATRVDPVTGATVQILSVYRRPRMSANLDATHDTIATQGPLAVYPHIDGLTGLPVTEPMTGRDISGNLMVDGREWTLETQARNALLTHAQALERPTDEQIARIVQFERQVFIAQSWDRTAGPLGGEGTDGAVGGTGPIAWPSMILGRFPTYDAWQPLIGQVAPSDTASVQGQRAAIARGAQVFNTKTFRIDQVSGFNNALHYGVTSPDVMGGCATCHGTSPTGSDPLPASLRDTGVSGQAEAFGGPAPLPDLPLFRITCHAPYTHPYYGTSFVTTDPGLATMTGRCVDVGRTSVPQLRGLNSRLPLLSNGSAASVAELVDFYDRRFHIGYTPQERSDLIAFLSAL